METFLCQLKDGKIHIQYLYVKHPSSPIHGMNFMVEVRKNVLWIGQLSYVGALTKSKLCQLSKLKYSAHAD